MYKLSALGNDEHARGIGASLRAIVEPGQVTDLRAVIYKCDSETKVWAVSVAKLARHLAVSFWSIQNERQNYD